MAGINSSASWTKAQLDWAKERGIIIAPKEATSMTRQEGGAPHAEQNIAAYLKKVDATGLRWSHAVVGKEGSYVCYVCRSIIKQVGGYIEPGF